MTSGSITPVYIAGRARDTANTIRRLPGIVREIVDANPCPTIEEVRRRLNPTKLEVDFGDVVLYVQRNWTPAHADRLVMQVAKVADGTRAFIAAVEHFARTPTGERAGLRLSVDGVFVGVCLMLAKAIDQWAGDIEAQAGNGKAERSKKPKTRRKRAKRYRSRKTTATVEMVKAYELKRSGFSLRAIRDALEQQYGEKAPKSPTTVGRWIAIAEAELNPKSRSARARQKLSEDRRGQADVMSN